MLFSHQNRGISWKFTFLGYEFKTRMFRGRMTFTPGMGKGALMKIRQTIKEKWHLKQRLTESLSDVAEVVNPVIRGWINYYGHHRRSELYKMAGLMDGFLVRFLKQKIKSKNNPRLTWNKVWRKLNEYKKENPQKFTHWYMISPSNR